MSKVVVRLSANVEDVEDVMRTACRVAARGEWQNAVLVLNAAAQALQRAIVQGDATLQASLDEQMGPAVDMLTKLTLDQMPRSIFDVGA